MFGLQLFRKPYRPLKLARDEHVVRYVNGTTAIVVQDSGISRKQYTVHSTVPLATKGRTPRAQHAVRADDASDPATSAGSSGGGIEPVNLALQPVDGSFDTENSADPVDISTNPADGVSFPEQSYSVHLQTQSAGADTGGSSSSSDSGELVGDTAWFGNVATNEDLAVMPLATGAELSLQLRGLNSPQDSELVFHLPPDTQLRMAPDGSGEAQIVHGGLIVGGILPPSATDAAGTSVPVTLALDPSDPDALSMDVANLSSYQLPVMVDPEILNFQVNTGSWYASAFNGWTFVSSTPTISGVKDPSTSVNGLYITANGAPADSIGEWYYQAPAGSYVQEVDFDAPINGPSNDCMMEGIYSSTLQEPALGLDFRTVGSTASVIPSPNVQCGNYDLNENETHCAGTSCTPGWDGAAAQFLDQDTAYEGMVTQSTNTSALLYMYGATVWLYDDIPPNLTVSGSGYEPSTAITSPTNLALSLNATDGSTSVPSGGVVTIVSEVNGLPTAWANPQTCPNGGCSLSLNATFNTGQLPKPDGFMVEVLRTDLGEERARARHQPGRPREIARSSSRVASCSLGERCTGSGACDAQ